MSLTDTSPQPEPKPSSPLQKVLPFTIIGVIIALLYVAWTFYSRHASDLEAQKQIAAKQEEARQRQNKLIFGGGEIRFLNYSADSGLLKAGQTAQLCYGVVNAKTLKLDPPVEDVKPSANHCLEIAPKKTTIYTLTAGDGAGHNKTVSLQIRVE